jgi:SEC-C motif-containing protein
MPSKDACPCGSGKPYKACCEPLHRGQREAPDAEALMRSRFAAFARREPHYLVRTLHPDHEDRALDEALLLEQLRTSAREFRYAGLAILDTAPPDGEGIARVLFLARVFHKSTERSFVELSDFAHDGAGWRYLRGTNMPVAAIKGDPMALRIPAFEPLVASRKAPR